MYRRRADFMEDLDELTAGDEVVLDAVRGFLDEIEEQAKEITDTLYHVKRSTIGSVKDAYEIADALYTNLH